jgi:hypothetical protein
VSKNNTNKQQNKQTRKPTNQPTNQPSNKHTHFGVVTEKKENHLIF